MNRRMGFWKIGLLMLMAIILGILIIPLVYAQVHSVETLPTSQSCSGALLVSSDCEGVRDIKTSDNYKEYLRADNITNASMKIGFVNDSIPEDFSFTGNVSLVYEIDSAIYSCTLRVWNNSQWVVSENVTCNETGTFLINLTGIIDSENQFENLMVNITVWGQNETNEELALDMIKVNASYSDVTKPSINFAPPTPDNQSTVNQSTITINVSHFDYHPDSIRLNWDDNWKETKTASGNWTEFQLTDLKSGEYDYYVWMNDTYGNINTTSMRTVTIDVASWWNLSWTLRKRMNLSNSYDSAVGTDDLVKLDLNTASMVSQGELQPDCDDLRIVYDNRTYTEELSWANTTPCNSSSTEIWFTPFKEISSGSYDNNYYLYYGNSEAKDPGYTFDVLWWNISWKYRQNLTVSNAAGNLTNYQVKIDLNSSKVGSNFNWTEDRNATRFTYYNSTSGAEEELSYWTENWNSTAEEATIWVKAPFLENNTNSTLFIYYGNPSAVSESNFDNTFTKDSVLDGLAGLWHMDEGSGQTAGDDSGNGNDGTLGNSTAGDSAEPTWNGADGGQWDGRSDVQFSTGDSLSFDGVDDKVEVPDDPSLDITNNITITAWINVGGRGRDNYMDVVRKKQAYILWWTDYSQVRNYVSIGGSWQYVVSSKSFSWWVDQGWVHVAHTYNGSALCFYINGEKDACAAVSGSIDTDNNAVGIGARSSIWDEWFNGLIDSVRIYNRALSAGEIKALYERRKYTSPEPNSTVQGEESFASTVSFAPKETAPVVTIDRPVQGAFLDSPQVSLNYTLNVDEDKCWYKLENSSGVYRGNTTLVGCSDVVIEVQNDTETRLTLYVNNSVGTLFTDKVNFTVDVSAPSFSIMNHTPVSVNESEDVECFSRWNDNFQLDSAVIEENGTGAFRNHSVPLTNGWANYTIPSNNLSAGTVTCRFYVNDSAGNLNSSAHSFWVEDITAPDFLQIFNEPNASDPLDPGVPVNVTANVTDNLGVAEATLQWKNSTSSWQNSSMSLINDIWKGSFTPPSEGNYTYRVQANDSAGNINISLGKTLEIKYDYSWTRSPSSFGIVSVIIDEEQPILNLTVNNTGDYNVSFSISADKSPSLTLSYNTSKTFNLSSKEVKTIRVNASSGTQAEYSVTFTIDNQNTSASPSSMDTTGKVIVTKEGPYHYLTVTEKPLSVTQGDSGVELEGKLENLGTNKSVETWMKWELPSGWSSDVMYLNKSIGNLSVGETSWHNITVDIASDAPTGTKTVTLSSGAVNASDTLSFQVDVNKKETAKTVTEEEGGGGGGGGAGRAAEGGLTAEQKRKLFQTEETYELVRGEDQYFVLTVENPFDKGALENVMLNITGYYTQYLSWEPKRIMKIPVNESKNFTIWIEAPKYFSRGENKLNFTITGINNQTTVRKVGNMTFIYGEVNRMKENRIVTLIIHEISRENASSYLNKSQALLNEMKREGFHTEEIENLLNRSKISFEEKNYKGVKDLCERIKSKKAKAFKAYSLIEEIEKKVEEADYRGIPTPKTKRMLGLAKAAFDRGAYETALSRIEEAKTTHALETKGKFNVLNYLSRNWLKVLITIIVLAIVGWITSIRIRLSLINRKLSNLEDEEETILGLMKQVQRECFEKKRLSMRGYQTAMMHYESELSENVKETVRLETKKAHLFKLGGEKARLNHEKRRITELMRKTQSQYLKEGKVETRIYRQKMKSFRERLSEIESRLAEIIAEEKISEELGVRSWFKGLFGVRT